MAVTLTADELKAVIKGAANYPGAADRLLAAATAMVEKEAPGAPEAIQNEAVIRFSGYLAQADYGTHRSETSVGNKSMEYVTNHSAMFRNCGAKGLLSPWKIRRAGIF